MTGMMQAVPDDDPLMIAWVEYTATAEYANSRRWAMQPPHTDGAMWAAFEAGYRAAKKEPTHEGA